ncbi:helix-turn-helix transcriptional regulator [bacterium]|jgi:transcriptional regulator with XRE-family HTH domain|nr:helix-turn-helix transcriptional regulator [bacterium]
MIDTLNETIASKIKSLRKQKGWTQSELASHVGTSQRAIVRLEKGETEPNVATLKKIALAFGLKLSIEFEDKTASKRPSCEHDLPGLQMSVNSVKETMKETISMLLNR